MSTFLTAKTKKFPKYFSGSLGRRFSRRNLYFFLFFGNIEKDCRKQFCQKFFVIVFLDKKHFFCSGVWNDGLCVWCDGHLGKRGAASEGGVGDGGQPAEGAQFGEACHDGVALEDVAEVGDGLCLAVGEFTIAISVPVGHAEFFHMRVLEQHVEVNFVIGGDVAKLLPGFAPFCIFTVND